MDIGVDRIDARTACVSIAGTVKMGAPPELEALLSDLLADGVTRLIVDLTDVGFMNSKVLDTLVRISARISPREGGVAVLTAQTYMKHMLEVTEDGGVLLLEDTKEAALEALAAA